VGHVITNAKMVNPAQKEAAGLTAPLRPPQFALEDVSTQTQTVNTVVPVGKRVQGCNIARKDNVFAPKEQPFVEMLVSISPPTDSTVEAAEKYAQTTNYAQITNVYVHAQDKPPPNVTVLVWTPKVIRETVALVASNAPETKHVTWANANVQTVYSSAEHNV